MGSGEGVGLEPGEVDHRLVGMQRRPAVDAPLPPPVRAGGPALRVGDVVVLLPRPALVATTTRGAGSRRPRRRQEGRVGDRGAADAEGRRGRRGGAGARCRRRSAPGAPMRNGPAGDLDRLEAGGAAPSRRAGAAVEAGRGGKPRELDRLQHRLVVLVLVLEHHLVDLGGAGALEDRERALADVGEVVERLGAVEDRQVAADGARRLERVVHRGELRVQQRLAAVAVDEPQVLIGGDVREIPRERAHQRRVRGLHLLVGERRDDGRACARGASVERVGDLRWRRARTSVLNASRGVTDRCEGPVDPRRSG